MIDLSRFSGPNAGYVAELYERFLQDPNAVDAETRRYFESLNGAAPPELRAEAEGGQPAPPPAFERPNRSGFPSVARGTSSSGLDAAAIAGAVSLARSTRVRGHLAARTDPLGTPPAGDPTLDPAYHGVTEQQLAQIPASFVGGVLAGGTANALEAIQTLRRIYCDTTGYEFIHVQVPAERQWLAEAVESQRFHTPMTPEAKKKLLQRLSEVEGFERYLHRTFPAQKRFSIEGTDMLVPMLDEVIAAAGRQGTREVVMGMAHRGRLNVLAHILGKPYADIIRKFHLPDQEHGVAASESAGEGFSGDVKYHLGARYAYQREDLVQVLLTLADNPSHLEFVDPVVEGMARASQDRLDRRGAPRQDEDAALPILMHGDAAFPGQGIVAETLNLSDLIGYRTGGTIHIIVNNQIGFTTNPREGRSTYYASDLAKGFEIPIVHVNADDPEACLAAARLAAAYRYRFHKDFLIDLVGYRRYGHNESDEPAYTQPRMYQIVAKHPTVRELWARRLQAEGVVSPEEAASMLRAVTKKMEAARKAIAEPQPESHHEPESRRREYASEVETAVPAQRLRQYNEFLLERPTTFTANTKLERPMQRRRAALDQPGGIDWAHAEALAFASILADGIPIRLTGQDVERGTFSQRHLVLHDPATGGRYIPLQALPAAKAAFALYNSPLSENAALGFEYGYSVQAPQVLVLWEAQFGDFANAAQVIIDQFIVSAEAKWGQHPTLGLLLPHGNEGQGPEHSSARLERFLQLAADDNLVIANCTTAAQYFHLLRCHALTLTETPRPLILMTPKSLLRHPRAGSSLEDLATGRFHPLLDDTIPPERRREVTRLVFCTGKVWVDLMEERERLASGAGANGAAPNGATEPAGAIGTEHVAVARIERLYPFPESEVRELIDEYPALEEVVWLQEEPRNMGAWFFVAPRLHRLLEGRFPLRYIGRPERSSPAEGSAERFAINQAELVRAAFVGEPSAISHEPAGVLVQADN